MASLTATPIAAPIPVAAPPGAVERPHLGAVLTRVALSVVTAVVVPAALLWLGLVLWNFTVAALLALAWLVAAVVWQWAARRSVSGLLLLTLAILVIRTGLALVTGSAFLYFVQPIFVDLTVAVIFLGSVCVKRPLVARLAPDFYPMDPVSAARPGVRALFRRLTLMWGLVILLKAAITLTLLETLTTVDFVVVKGGAIALLTMTTAVVTIVWSVAVARREGLIRPR